MRHGDNVMETYYNISDIAIITETKYEEVLEIAKNYNAAKLVSNSYLVDSLLVPKVIEKIYEDRHITTTYKIQSWIKSSSEEWAKVLIELYQNPLTHPASISPQQGELLRSIILNNNPQTVVEIGTFMGVSTIWSGSALKDLNNNGQLFSIDLFNDILPCKGQRTRCLINPYDKIKENIKKCGIENHTRLIKGDSKKIGEKWSEISKSKIDILFIDGDHTIKGCFDDFKSFLPYISTNGLIILHDIYPDKCGCYGPRFLLDNISRDNKVQILEIETSPYNFGMAILRFHSPNG